MELLRSLYRGLFPQGIPLAWKQLMVEKKRFAAALAGIMFAVTLMLFQLGLRSALFAQVVAPHVQLQADLVIIDPQYEYLGLSRTIPRARLTQALALEEVTAVAPLWLGNLPFRNPETGLNRDIFILAIDPADTAFLNPEISGAQGKLQQDGAALFDIRSHPQFGPIAEALAESPVRSELAGKAIEVEGLFTMGITFAADGNLVIGKDTFFQVWPGSHRDEIMVGLITLKPGSDREAAAERLRKLLPGDVTVLTREGFLDRETTYWNERTPIGFVISASLLVAMVVGAVIVYQILYTDVTDHLPEYATLKALGYRDRFFIGLVLQESIILSLLGFIPGLGLTIILYHYTRELAYMPAYLTVDKVLLVLALTLTMCLLAGALATRKLRQADPAAIFN